MLIDKQRDPDPPIKKVVLTLTLAEWNDLRNMAAVYMTMTNSGQVTGESYGTACDIWEAK